MSDSQLPSSKVDNRGRNVLIIAALAGIVAAFAYFQQRRPPAAQAPAEEEAASAAQSQDAARESAVVADDSSLPKIPFVDATQQLGVTFVPRGGDPAKRLLPDSGGAGCGLFDYDRDGDLDLLFIGGRPWPGEERPSPPASTLALFRNDGNVLADVTDETGLTADFYGQGVAVGDYDADGDDDVLVTAVGQNHLYRNDAGHFVDATATAGLAGDAEDWTTSAGFFDHDRDGDLDLFVCNYVRWSPELDAVATMRLPGAVRSFAIPENFDGTHNYLYRNDGGRFTDVSAEAGIRVTDPATGNPVAKALAVTFVDFDRDGWLDIFVANDTVRHLLFRNLGNGKFEEIGEARAFAFNSAGAPTSGMGIDAAWLFNDSRLAVAVSNFADEMTEVFVTQKGEPTFFADEAVPLGVGQPTRPVLSFGLLMDDLDLDGRVDLIQANGHLEETVKQVMPTQRFQQPAQVFWNAGSDERPPLVELPSANIGDLAKPIVGRALASGDLDGDGDVDLVLTLAAGPPVVAINNQASEHHWLRLRLEGPAGNPHAIGAVVELRAGGVSQRRTLMPTRSYLAYCEPAITFGLGDAAAVDSLSVVWPDGTTQQVAAPAVDQVVTVRPPDNSFASLANRAKGELENGNVEPAIELLKQALQQEPKSFATRRNLVRAYLLSSRPDEALAELNRLTGQSPTPYAGSSYLRGLAELRQTDYERAAEDFQKAVALDPDDATLRFQWGLALLGLNRAEDARTQLEKAAELDPLHGAAQYQLASLARKAGDQEAYGRYMRDYVRIRDLRGAVSAVALEACRYTIAEPPEISAPSPSPVPPAVTFTGTDLPIDGADSLSIAAVGVTGVDSSGRYRLAAVAKTGELLNAEFDAASRLHQVARVDQPLGEIGSLAVLRVANAMVDRPGTSEAQSDRLEIAIVTPSRTWFVREAGAHAFEDLSEAAQLSQASGTAAQWIDVEHDGDVDLCVASPTGLHVWRNNGDGTFADESESYGLGGAGPVADLAAADFEGTNLGVDLVLAAAEHSLLYRNQLAGKFIRDQETSSTWPAAARVLVDDFNNDGLPDVVFLSPESATLLIAGSHDRQAISLNPVGRIAAATTIDVDNDGWLDIAVAGESVGAVLRNLGGRFAPQSQALSLPPHSIARQFLDLDADGDGDTDLVLLTGDGRLHLLRNESPTGNRQLKLAINSYVGNPSSAGVRVQVRAEDHVVTRWTNREAPIEIGMGSHDVADVVQTLWPNGIAKNEIDVKVTGEPVPISVIEFIRTDSCPFLYAFQDGKWRFLNDLLGTAPLNVVAARGVIMPGFPDEAVVLGPAEQFQDGDATARLRVTSELREVVYIDQTQLLAVDHPVGTTLFSRDRVAPESVEGPRFALGQTPVELRATVSSDGVDRTDALVALDGVFAPPGRVLPPPAVGFTEPLSLELDFGEFNANDDLLLALTGWLRFGNSSANIAASQRGDLQVIWPRLEAAGADGKWQLVEEMVGLPAGNTKTIVCDLRGKLPAGARMLRLTTSFEVRWDRIALYHAADESRLRTTAVAPTTAELAWHGFSELRPRGNDVPQEPKPDRISDRPPWVNIVAGWCTRYGDITPLLVQADDQSAILNSGDGATLVFPADKLPALRRGEARTLVLATRGWIKAADPNSEPDMVVWPFPGAALPFDAEQADQDWQLRYNTRWIPGNRFDPR